MIERLFDVVVIGAGTAGAAAAWHLARQGRRVALVERGTFEGAGARWVNNVPDWMFERAGLAPPSPPERWADGFLTIVMSPGGARLGAGRATMTSVDMRALVERTQRLALEAGVEPFEGKRVVEVMLDGDRPLAIACARADGSDVITLRARLFVDASGLGGAMRKRIPLLARDCTDVAPRDMCSAAMEVRHLASVDGAKAFLDERRADPGDFISLCGFDGGFSTLGVVVNLARGHVEILTGVVDDGRHGTGGSHLGAFVKEHAWVGERVFGGGGLLPIRRPYARFTSPGVALVGNAACQVFPAHGSGVGSGLVAAAILGEATRGEDDPGSLRAMWRYQSRFQREVGGVHAAYDAFRIATQDLTPSEMDALVASGLMTEAASRTALEQRTPHFSTSDLVQMARGAIRERQVAAKLVPAVARMEALKRIYRRYPEEPSERALERWKQVEAAVG